MGVIGQSNAGNCLFATRGGKILAEGATISGALYGAVASLGGLVDVSNATIANCDYGCLASLNGVIDVEQPTFNMNIVYDLQATDGGVIDALMFLAP